MTTTMAVVAAKERQLDWLLGEVLGGVTVHSERAARRRSRSPTQRWLLAAVVMLAAGAAVGTALLRRDEAANTAQQPQGNNAIEWHEAHGPAAFATVPADVRNLRCFDFDDATVAGLVKFPQLERLDLSGTDVNEQGYSVTSPITDTGVAALGKLVGLRWLSLASCQKVKGTGLASLENLPKLEHLDLTFTQVDSATVERLQRLPSLRELSLSYCTRFHGRSLAAVAQIPGLRELRLQGCTTVRAADVLHLAKLHELRHLDLRDCQGRFRGQTMSMGGEIPADTPQEDGIGVTDASIAALAGPQLEALLLGGCESLTDAIGETFAKLPSLLALDLTGLPKVTGKLLGQLPEHLLSLRLDDSSGLDGAALGNLPKLPQLVELGLSGLLLRDTDIAAVLAGRQLQSLHLGGEAPSLANAMRDRRQPQLTGQTAAAVAAQANLRMLDLAHAAGVDAAFLARIATLPQLTELQLTLATVTPDLLRPLARCRSLASLRFTYSSAFDPASLQELTLLPLRDLDLYGTNLNPAAVEELAKAWPGCTIKMPKGQSFRVPVATK